MGANGLPTAEQLAAQGKAKLYLFGATLVLDRRKVTDFRGRSRDRYTAIVMT
jgi:hypothetical protein